MAMATLLECRYGMYTGSKLTQTVPPVYTPVRAASCCRRAVDSAWARAPLKSAAARASDIAGLLCPVSPSPPPRLSRSSARALFRARSSPTSLQPRVLHPASESRCGPPRGRCATVPRLAVPRPQGRTSTTHRIARATHGQTEATGRCRLFGSLQPQQSVPQT